MEPFGALLPSLVWREFTELGEPRVFRPGEHLLRQGDPAGRIVVLLSGRVKVSLVDPAGNRVLLAVRGPGEVLGEISLLDGTYCSATVAAVDSCATRVVAAGHFERLLQRHGLRDRLVAYAMQRLREGESVRLELATLAASERVVRGLLRLAVSVSPEQTAVDIGLDQQELGLAVGLSRSSVARSLADLRAGRLVSTRRGRIVINDIARLRALSSE
jgi:CRP-like cAMP-binding protein